MRKREQRRLTPDDWARAALEAIAKGGVESVAVETVAAELGATKGSFYWHFENRDALIRAALERWEQRRTEAVIDWLEMEPDPAKRLRAILDAGIDKPASDRAEIALLANPSHPEARRTVTRVMKRRLAYIATQLESLGYGPRDAMDRAVLISYVYLGHIKTAQVAPRLVSAEDRRRQVDLIFDSLVARAPTSTAPSKP